MAIRAQYHDQWEPDIEVKENMFLRYLRDFLALIGLLVALVVTLSLTSIAGAAQADCRVSRPGCRRMAASRLDNYRPDYIHSRQLSAVCTDSLDPAAHEAEPPLSAERHTAGRDRL